MIVELSVLFGTKLQIYGRLRVMDVLKVARTFGRVQFENFQNTTSDH